MFRLDFMALVAIVMTTSHDYLTARNVGRAGVGGGSKNDSACQDRSAICTQVVSE
jgi:hypothetical protein